MSNTVFYIGLGIFLVAVTLILIFYFMSSIGEDPAFTLVGVLAILIVGFLMVKWVADRNDRAEARIQALERDSGLDVDYVYEGYAHISCDSGPVEYDISLQYGHEDESYFMFILQDGDLTKVTKDNFTDLFDVNCIPVP